MARTAKSAAPVIEGGAAPDVIPDTVPDTTVATTDTAPVTKVPSAPDKAVAAPPPKKAAPDKTAPRESGSEIQDVLGEIKSNGVLSGDSTGGSGEALIDIGSKEMIPCRSVVRGTLVWKCQKSGIMYRWPSIRHLEYIPFEDVYQMYTNSRSYLTKPYVIVEDDRVISNFSLLNIYKDIAKVGKLDVALRNPAVMREKCELALSVNMKDFLTERLIELRNEGSLTNIDVINTAESLLKRDIIKK
jgi:hypothetical protein